MSSKHFLSIAFIIFVSINLSFSQDFWEQLYFPDSTEIRCITTNSQGHIFVGAANDGVSGGLYRSTDSANSWELVFDAQNKAITEVAINTEDHIFIGGAYAIGSLHISKDNGDTWVQIAVPSVQNITHILPVDSDTLYISTAESGGGCLRRTVNEGLTWDSLFLSGHVSEKITDISKSSSGDIFISLMGYFNNTGGVYKSTDNGYYWEFLGLFNHQVKTMAMNSQNEVFTGDWSAMPNDPPGIYALYDGYSEFELIYETSSINDMVINSDNVLYTCSNHGILRSFDNGQSFEYVNEGLISLVIENMHLADSEYIYITNRTFLGKSKNSTITSISDIEIVNIDEFYRAFPNPTSTVINIKLTTKDKQGNDYTIVLRESFGSKVFCANTKLTDNQYKVDVSSLKPGIYFLEVSSELLHQTEKIIIK